MAHFERDDSIQDLVPSEAPPPAEFDELEASTSSGDSDRNPSFSPHAPVPNAEGSNGDAMEGTYEEFDPPRDTTYIPRPRENCPCGTSLLQYSSEPWHIPPYPPKRYTEDYKQVFREILAGFTVAFAQVPGSLAFASIAGLDPLLGLHPAWIIGFFTSAFGSRPGMINGATGVRAATIAPYVDEHGVGMLFWIILMISVYQFLFALLSLPRFVKLLPRAAMIGFSNGLAVVIFLGQFTQFRFDCDCPEDGDWRHGTTIAFMLMVVGITILVSVLFDKFVPVSIPPSLFGILAAVIVEHGILRAATDFKTPTIGEVGDVSGGFPKFFWVDPQYDGEIPYLDGETIKIVLWPAFIAAAAGAVEAVMTMEVINDLTETGNPVPNQQLYALSAGNFVSGLFGTMGGGATIGESVINILNGANGWYRISGLVAAFTVFLFIMVAAPMIEAIPVASLVGVMVMISFKVFEWESVPMVLAALFPQSWRESRFMRWWAIRKITRVDAIVIIVVVALTLVFDLFTGTAAGTLIAAADYCWQSGFNLSVRTSHVYRSDGAVLKKIYYVEGPLFFASAMRFPELVTPKKDPELVELHFSHSSATLYDYSAIHTLRVVSASYAALGKKLVIKDLDARSYKMLLKADGAIRDFSYFGATPADEKKDDDAKAVPMYPHVAREAYERRALRRQESFV